MHFDISHKPWFLRNVKIMKFSFNRISYLLPDVNLFTSVPKYYQRKKWRDDSCFKRKLTGVFYWTHISSKSDETNACQNCSMFFFMNVESKKTKPKKKEIEFIPITFDLIDFAFNLFEHQKCKPIKTNHICVFRVLLLYSLEWENVKLNFKKILSTKVGHWADYGIGWENLFLIFFF